MTTMMRASSRPQVRPRPPAPGVHGVDPTDTPCRGADPDIFFAESPDGVETAKALCRACPMQLRCLTEAIERREPCGVWGGELFAEGAVVPRKRPRGRPRKHDAERDAIWFAQHAELLQQTEAVA